MFAMFNQLFADNNFWTVKIKFNIARCKFYLWWNDKEFEVANPFAKKFETYFLYGVYSCTSSSGYFSCNFTENARLLLYSFKLLFLEYDLRFDILPMYNQMVVLNTNPRFEKVIIYRKFNLEHMMQFFPWNFI